MSTTVETEISIYEQAGKEIPLGTHPLPTLKLSSHWNKRGVMGLAILETPKGEKFTVPLSDLRAATGAIAAAER